MSSYCSGHKAKTFPTERQVQKISYHVFTDVLYKVQQQIQSVLSEGNTYIQ